MQGSRRSAIWLASTLLLAACGGDPAAASGDATDSDASSPFAPSGPSTDDAGPQSSPFGDVASIGADADATDPGLCIPFCLGKTCGDDGCGGSCGECALGSACVGDQCSEAPKEGPTCAEAWPCVQKCGDDLTCAEACGAESSPDVRARLEAAIRCEPESCAVCGEDRRCASHCRVEQCGDAVFGCFHGDQGCKDVIECAGACATDSACVEACVRAGTEAAQRSWYDLVFCVAEECGPSAAAECRTLVTGVGGQCRDLVEVCASTGR